MTNGKGTFTNEIDFSDYDKQKDLTVMENRYDRYKDSGIDWIGEIPEHWNISLIGRYFKEINNPNSAQEETNTLQFKLGEIIPKSSGNSKYNPESIESYNIVGPGTIMINGLNLSFDFISQRVAQVKEKGAITSSYIAIYPTDKLFSNYATFLLKSYDNCKALHAMGKGLRAILSYNILRSESIIIPPLAEQQAIADYLDRRCNEIDDLIALQEEMITKLQSYKQSVITEAVTRGLDKNVPLKDSDIDWIGKIPEHWSRNKIVRLFSIIGSGTTPKSNKEDNYIGSINWIQSGDINGGYIENCKNTISKTVLKEYSALKIYKAPFIIVAMYGASVGNISISKIDGCVNQACCVMNDTEQNFRYLFYSIISVKNYLIYKAEGGGQPNISQDKIKNTWLPIPPLAEQQAIADYLDQRCSEIDELIALKQQKIEKLKEYKKSLIFECVTGKRKVS